LFIKIFIVFLLNFEIPYLFIIRFSLFLSISERSVQIQNESITRLCITNSGTSYSKFSFSSPIQASLYPYLFIFPAQPRDYKRNLQTHTLGPENCTIKKLAKQPETRDQKSQITTSTNKPRFPNQIQNHNLNNTTQPCCHKQPQPSIQNPIRSNTTGSNRTHTHENEGKQHAAK